MTSASLRFVRRSALALTLAVTAQAASADSTTVLPFNATLSITEQVAFTGGAPCFGIGSLQGTGTSTVGAISGSSQDCINPVGVFDPNAPSFQFVSTPPGVVLKTAGGDQLFALYAGTLTYRAGAPHLLNGFFIVTGGTGRFKDAIGGGTLTGQETIDPVGNGAGQVSFTGRIQVGKSRR